MKEIGNFLKRTRIQNGVSLEEASEDLNISTNELENLEEGNIRAFKDVYALKDLVKEYSKYLGKDPDKVLDEFNDFMFEHTSKISLEDIKEAKQKIKEMDEKPKILSPYSYIPKEKKFDLSKIKWKRVLGVIGVLLVIILIGIIWNMVNKKDDKVNNELQGRMMNYYELSN